MYTTSLSALEESLTIVSCVHYYRYCPAQTLWNKLYNIYYPALYICTMCNNPLTVGVPPQAEMLQCRFTILTDDTDNKKDSGIVKTFSAYSYSLLSEMCQLFK